MKKELGDEVSSVRGSIKRREVLKAAPYVFAAPAVLSGFIQSCTPKIKKESFRKGKESKVCVIKTGEYEAGILKSNIEEGMRTLGIAVEGKRIVIKPNFVETSEGGIINTNPLLIGAVVETLRILGARDVNVAEGPGHQRDTEAVLATSGLDEILRGLDCRFVDLNMDDVDEVELGSNFTGLKKMFLPSTILKTDLILSMPKMKTHHWVGVTLSMKNLFGCVPGSIYGWPKNTLHWAGIEHSILDISATLPKVFAIVDGIVGMEGDGPIMGSPVESGVLVMGTDLVSVDSTSARIMGFAPEKIGYIKAAGTFLGNIEERRIVQTGEDPYSLSRSYDVLEIHKRIKA